MRRAVEFGLVLAGVLAALALGGVAIVYGGADDSPGLQGIGVIVVVGATVTALRWRGGRDRPDVRRPGSPACRGCGRRASARR